MTNFLDFFSEGNNIKVAEILSRIICSYFTVFVFANQEIWFDSYDSALSSLPVCNTEFFLRFSKPLRINRDRFPLGGKPQCDKPKTTPTEPVAHCSFETAIMEEVLCERRNFTSVSVLANRLVHKSCISSCSNLERR